MDWDEIWQDCSSSKYAVEFLMTSYFKDGGHDVRQPLADAAASTSCLLARRARVTSLAHCNRYIS